MQLIGVGQSWWQGWVIHTVLVSLLTAQLCAQTPPAADEPVVSLKTTTRMVLVDLVVTDKHGAPVTDLVLDDLTVLEDSKAEKIALFSRYPDAERSPGHPPAEPVPVLNTDVHTNRPEYRQEAGPLTVLLLDGINTATADQVQVRQEMLRYLRTQLRPQQKVAILALTSELIMLQNFTSDSGILISALEKFHPGKSVAISRGEPEMITRLMAESMRPQALENLKRMNQARAVQSIDERARITLEALRVISRAMLGYPGRKNLIWVSSAFPFSLLLEGKNFDLSRDYGTEIRQATNLLADAQIAVYTVDARGLVGGSTPGLGPGELVPTIESSEQPVYGDAEMTREPTQMESSHSLVQELARETGGRAFYNGNDLNHAVAASIADGSTYYTLGYYPTNKQWDGKFRRIEVKTRRKGIKLRARAGYYALDSSANTAASATTAASPDRIKELLAAVSAPLPATGVTFRVHISPPPAGQSLLELEFLVDVNTVSFEAVDPDLEHCSFDFAVFSVAANGNILDSQSKTVDARLKPAQYASVSQQGLPFRMQVKSMPESQQLLVAVRDNRTGLLGTLAMALPSEVVQQKPQ